MDQIGADRMAPVHVAPVPAIRVVLEEQMVLALVKHQPIWIVDASRGGR